ncbi:MAG: cell wall hydrolase [Betaproteobacteria bacterium]|nr:cell wall hydrolase [Betaproteobacteria bacterium]
MKFSAQLAALWLVLAASLPVLANDSRPPESATASAGYLERAREITVQALSLLGVNYKWGSSSPERGFDCSGLVTHVFQQVAGVVLPRSSQNMSKVGEKIDKSDLQPGDLVFFNTRRRPNSHVGIYIGDDQFVHAPGRGGEVEISGMQESYWKKRFNGARRMLFND